MPRSAKKKTTPVAVFPAKKARKKGAKKGASPIQAKALKLAKAAKTAKLAKAAKAARSGKKSGTPRLKKTKYVYFFGTSGTDGDGSLGSLLGEKGANLADLSRLGLPVPPGFTISSEVGTWFCDHQKTHPPELAQQVSHALARIEKEVGQKLGDSVQPLLLSIRPAARDSLRETDTILNLGLNDSVVEILAETSGHPKFAWDSYRRFLQMYGTIAMGVQKRPGEENEPFEAIIDEVKRAAGVALASDLSVEHLRELVARFKARIKERTGRTFPQDPTAQLWGAIGAIFSGWQQNSTAAERGAAVSIQVMVFGNKGATSASGVAFTRDLVFGKSVVSGEYLLAAQGEDVVSSARRPQPVARLAREMPKAHKELLAACDLLEKHFKDAQELDFTIENGRLFILETRPGTRSGRAAVQIAVDMVGEKRITRQQAIQRIPAEALAQVFAPLFDRASLKTARKIATGLPAGPGAATGKIVFQAADALRLAQGGERGILVCDATSPEDLRGMIAAAGILTTRGGLSSQAAFVARQMGQVCVCGASDLQIDTAAQTFRTGSAIFAEGDWLSIDGTTGEVYAGKIKTGPSEVAQVLISRTLKPAKSKIYESSAQLISWAGTFKKLEIRAEVDSPEAVAEARALGAIGVACEGEDFRSFLAALHSLPATICLRPGDSESIETQARGLFEAAAEEQKKGASVKLEILIPRIRFAADFRLPSEIVHRAAAEVQKKQKLRFSYVVGARIEVPRACLIAGEIAAEAQFLVFDSHALTELMLGTNHAPLSSSEAAEIGKADPFKTIDPSGVGEMMKIAIAAARKVRPGIRLGLCGRHGDDPESVKFCHRLGLDYVSCSPSCVPAATLAAAQAALETP